MLERVRGWKKKNLKRENLIIFFLFEKRIIFCESETMIPRKIANLFSPCKMNYWVWESLRVTSRGRFPASFKFSTRGRKERRGEERREDEGVGTKRKKSYPPRHAVQPHSGLSVCLIYCSLPLSTPGKLVTLLSISLSRQRESRSIVFFILRIENKNRESHDRDEKEYLEFILIFVIKEFVDKILLVCVSKK